MKTYIPLITKIKAMNAKLLNSNDYKNLAYATSVVDFASYLKNHPSYLHSLAAYDEQLLHREELEHILTKTLYHDYDQLYRFCNIEQRTFLKLFFLVYESDLLKTILYHLHHKKKDNYILDLKSFWKKYSTLDIDLLYEARSLEEFKKVLDKSIYQDAMLRLTPQDNIFLYEKALDRFVFKYFWQKKHHLLNNGPFLLKKIEGKQVDLLNIIFIYRAKTYYSMDVAEIVEMLIPIQYQLDENGIKDLIMAPTTEDFFKALSQSKHSYLLDDFPEMSLEEIYPFFISKVLRSLRLTNPLSFVSVYEYLFKKFIEVHQLTTLLESLRYGKPPELILEKLHI